MRLVFSFILSFLIIKYAFADEYTFILKTQIHDEFYINENTIQQDNNGYLVEVLNSYGHADPFNGAWSSIQTIYFDCNQSMQLMSDKFLSKKMGKGEVIQSSNFPMPKMALPKGSAFDEIQNFICSSNVSSSEDTNDTDELVDEIFKIIEQNSAAIAEGLQHANTTGLMSSTESFTFIQKMSSGEVSHESANILGTLCLNLDIDSCALILVEASNYENGIDEYTSILMQMIKGQ